MHVPITVIYDGLLGVVIFKRSKIENQTMASFSYRCESIFIFTHANSLLGEKRIITCQL